MSAVRVPVFPPVPDTGDQYAAVRLYGIVDYVSTKGPHPLTHIQVSPLRTRQGKLGKLHECPFKSIDIVDCLTGSKPLDALLKNVQQVSRCSPRNAKAQSPAFFLMLSKNAEMSSTSMKPLA